MSTNSLNNTQIDSSGFLLQKKDSKFPFYLTLFYLFLEYGRPQIYLTFLEPLHFPAITVMLLLFMGVLSKKFKWNDNQTILYLLLLGLMVIHGPTAANNYWTLQIFILMVVNLIAYLSISNFIDNQEKFNKMVSVWMAIHVFLAIIGIIHSGSGTTATGIGGFLGDENDFCMTMNMIIPLSFFLAVCSSGRKKIYYIILSCLFIFVVFLTNSRGGFLGLCAMFLYCWLRTKRKMITGSLIVLLVAFAVVFAPSRYWDRIKTIQTEGTRGSGGSGEERLYEWNIGWHMFLDNPVMGVGQGNFPFVFKRYEEAVMGGEDPFYGRSVAGRAAHSIYFTLLPELGLIGLFIFIGIVYYNLKDLNKIKSLTNIKNKINKSRKIEDKSYYMAIALEGGLISYLVSGIFISILYYPNYWINMGFIISLRKIVLSKADNLRQKTST